MSISCIRPSQVYTHLKSWHVIKIQKVLCLYLFLKPLNIKGVETDFLSLTISLQWTTNLCCITLEIKLQSLISPTLSGLLEAMWLNWITVCRLMKSKLFKMSFIEWKCFSQTLMLASLCLQWSTSDSRCLRQFADSWSFFFSQIYAIGALD